MPQLDLVVIGASAGGLEPLLDILGELPADLRTTILVVMHTPRTAGSSYLPEVLSRRSALPVAFATDGERHRRGHVYVAPANVHVLVHARKLVLSQGPKENGFRPSIDPSLRSAARSHGPRAMGVILSGALDDGTHGLRLLKQAGGLCVVQDPDEASMPSMPLNAIRFVAVDHVLPAVGIAELIAELAGRSAEEGRAVEEEPAMARNTEPEPQNREDETDVKDMVETFGPPSGLTCPDCGGALWEVQDGQLTRYRCHVGHQYTVESLDAGQQEATEVALWSAVRILEEHAELRERMAKRTGASGMAAVSESFAESARDSKRQAHTIRELLYRRGPAASEPVAVEVSVNAKDVRTKKPRRSGR